MLRQILKAGVATSLIGGGLLFGQFKRADTPSQEPLPAPQDQMQQPPMDASGDGEAEGPGDAADAQHGVARISFVSGQVNVQRGGNAGTVAAAINAPVLANDRLQTGDRSSAELQLDAGTAIRVAQNTNVGFGSLEEVRFQVQLGLGSVIYRVLGASRLGGELDTPNIAIRPTGPANFRVSVGDDGTTQIDMRDGTAEIFGPRGSQRLEAGHAYLVRGNPTDPEFQETAAALREPFDDWSDSRDQQAANSQSAQYVGPDVPGTADLDVNGNWVPSSYGAVWTPSAMPANWAPYSNGFWSYEDYYGWTWVDYAPWGWAPYHYGRWFRNGVYGWCWWPGSRVGIHYWRPAVVGFFGWGGNRGLGWVPLAPRERFRGWWGRRAQGFNFGGGNIYSSYRNASFRGAVTFASFNNFGGPGQHFSHLSRQQLGGASVFAGRIPVTPTRASYSFSQRQAFPIARSGNYAGRSSVSTERYHIIDGNSAARSPGRVTIYGGRSSWNRVGSQPAGSTRPAQRPQAESRGESQRNNGSGWQKFGDPGRNSGYYRQGFTGSGNNRPSGNESGWHDFGRPTVPQAQRQYTPQPRPQQQFNGGGSWNRSQPQPRSNGGGSPQQFSAPSRPNSGGSGGRGGGGGRR